MTRAMFLVNPQSIIKRFLVLFCSVLAPTIAAQTRPERAGQQDDVVRVSLKIFPLPENSPAQLSRAIYEFHAWLPAGLYQVRVGVRDLKTGHIGSAVQWIQVPNLLVR